jgi:Protein of unknown function (DUF3102)
MEILTMTLDTDSSVIMSAREPPNDLVGLAAGANTEHDAVAQHQRVALEHAIKAGSFLAAAKDRLPHGRWLPWLAHNCPTISKRTAQVYLQLHYRQADLKCADVPAHLTIDDALKVIAKKKAIEKPARAKALAKRETVADLKQQVAQLRTALDKADGGSFSSNDTPEDIVRVLTGMLTPSKLARVRRLLNGDDQSVPHTSERKH